MIKFLVLATTIFISQLAIAQTVTVKKISNTVKGESMDGYATEVTGKRADATSTLTKILKEHGKIKFLSFDPIVVSNPMLGGTLYEKGILYGVVKEGISTATIWIGKKASDWSKPEIETVEKELEKLVYQTGVQFYRDQVQREIDQTQQAIDAVEKQLTKATTQGKDLAKKLVNNDVEKVKLDQALEANKFEDAVLKVKIENNKKALDSLANSLTPILEIKKMHEERMKKIN